MFTKDYFSIYMKSYSSEQIICIRYEYHVAQSAEAVEYADCIFAEEEDLPNECSGYDTKLSDGKAPVMSELWQIQIPLHCNCSQAYSGLEW